MKFLIKVLKGDIVDCVGSIQLCGGQGAGYEAIAHCINRLFHLNETEGLLFVDAMSAFNLLN